jgi:hypothetical protein
LIVAAAEVAIAPALVARSANFGLEIERHDSTLVGIFAPSVSRQGPHDLELVAIRVGSVQRDGDTVVGLAGESTVGPELVTKIDHVFDIGDLPRQVIKACRVLAPFCGSAAEETEVVVVGGSRSG